MVSMYLALKFTAISISKAKCCSERSGVAHTSHALSSKIKHTIYQGVGVGDGGVGLPKSDILFWVGPL